VIKINIRHKKIATCKGTVIQDVIRYNIMLFMIFGPSAVLEPLADNTAINSKSETEWRHAKMFSHIKLKSNKDFQTSLPVLTIGV
jgi:hypothetical protein